MSLFSSSKEPTRTAGHLVVAALVYFVAHLFGSTLSEIPAADELVQIDAQGQVELLAAEKREWYLTASQLEEFDVEQIRARNKQLATLSSSVREQIANYSESTKGSNPTEVQRLVDDLDLGLFTKAVASWQAIQAATSPKTLAAFGHNAIAKVDAELRALEVAKSAQRAAVSRLLPTGKPGFLWTSPAGAPFEVLAIASLAALTALFLRRRALALRGYQTGEGPRRHGFGYAVGPLLALFVWTLARPRLEFAQYGVALLAIGTIVGFGLPYLARGLARLAGKDPERVQRRTQSSQRKSRIVSAMKDLRPGSFAELKRAASQFAAEIVTAEVEDHPQS